MMRLPLRHAYFFASASAMALMIASPAAADDVATSDAAAETSDQVVEATEAGAESAEAGAEAAAAASSSGAITGSVAASGARIFTAADFSRFAPRTALDMVRQIPGFSIDGGNQGSRGLGQASQNILLNGQRVSGKSNDARSTLTRIDADDVERIEIADGATLDIPGLSGQVANIIYKATNFGGTFRWEPQYRSVGTMRTFSGELSLNGRFGKTEWAASLSNNNSFRDRVLGPERRFAGAGTSPISDKRERANFFGDRPRLSASLTRTADNGNILNLNAVGEIWRFRREFLSQVTFADDSIVVDRDKGGEDEWNAELGGDYEFALGAGRLKLIGLQRFEHSVFKNNFTSTPLSDPMLVSSSRFPQTVDESESIARGEYRWNMLGGDWQISLEGAYNKLTSEAALFIGENGQPEQEFAVPGANATVDEKRAEFILTHSRELANGLTAQLNLGGEYSAIGVDGQAANEQRRFFRPKGSLSLAWRAADDLTINVSIERIVDQLNFFDFLANVDLVNNNDRADNPSLVPPQRWRFEMEATKRLGDWGTITPKVRYELVEDVVESIPVSPTAEALGNLPKATRIVLQAEGTLLLDPLGFQGAKIDFETRYIGTNIEDPLTGEDRELSGTRDLALEFDFRHDVPDTNWAWGAGVEYNEFTANLRLNEATQFREEAPTFSAFIENKNVAGLTMRASVYNIFDRKNLFQRISYVDRRDGPAAFNENFVRSFGRIFTLTLSGSL